MDSTLHNDMQDTEGENYPCYGEGGQDGYPYQDGHPAQDEDAASDATEGHDEHEHMYGGEYHGIPHPDEMKEARRVARSEAKQAAADEEETLAEQYENIMEDCGHGRFQWTLFVVLGLALLADGVECFVVAFAMPSAEKDMCLSNADKGLLGLIVYVGMMLGAVVWGGLADKLGRRHCLLYALAINCTFSFLSSFARGYGLFLFFRLCSGFGEFGTFSDLPNTPFEVGVRDYKPPLTMIKIGGSGPIVYTYFAEFLQTDKRGEHLSWLCLSWMMGGLYASLAAWGIIPHYGWGFGMGTELRLHSWRVFVLVCVLPSVASLAGLLFVPESPRYLLETARPDEAWMILRRVHDTNWRAKGEPERVFQVSQFKTPYTQDDEFIEIQCDTRSAFQRFLVRQVTLVKQVTKNLMSLAAPDLRLHGLFIIIVWFTMAFGYHGLSVWFPDQIKHLQYEDYRSKTKTFQHEKIEGFHFNFTLQNQIHEEGQYTRDRFIGIEMRSVKFKGCLFVDCYFEDIESTDALFENCTVENTVFYNTDLWRDSKFHGCELVNVTFSHPKPGCHLNLQEENDVLVYLVGFLGGLSVLPGGVVSGLLMDKTGRVRVVGVSMLLSSGCSFSLFLCFSAGLVIASQCLFHAACAAAWNGIGVLTVELYPASKRATAFGVLSGFGKMAAIAATLVFSRSVGVTEAVPIILSFSALVCGGLLALKLPETRGVALQ